jgi:transposase-like protein
MTERRKYKSESERRDTVTRWKASGLTQAEFCRRENMEQWELSEWKRWVQRQDKKAPIRKTKPTKPKPPVKKGSTAAVVQKDRRELVSEYLASGLSMRAFSAQKGLNAHRLKQWHREFGDGIEQPLNAAGVNPFVALNLAEPRERIIESAVLEIVLPGGGLVRVTENTPLHLLSKVLRELEGKC